MKKTISLLVLPIILYSCSLNNSPENNLSGKVESIKISRDTETIIAKEYKGLYSPGRFSDCENSEQFYLTKDSTKKLDSLYKTILSNSYNGQTICIEVKGFVNKFTGKGRTYSRLNILEIIKAEQKNYKNDCINADYWGTGTEPFWQLQISEKENLIDFYNPMEQKTTHFLYSKPEMKNGVTSYSSSDKENKIRILIKKEKCNGAIDPQYDYSVQVSLNDKKYNGCAMIPNITK